jgi:hypothetical protein
MLMVRIQLVKYRKRYLTKAIYNCKRYLFYVPVDLGEKLDPSVDYEVRFYDPYIILIPKNLSHDDTIYNTLVSQGETGLLNNNSGLRKDSQNP